MLDVRDKVEFDRSNTFAEQRIRDLLVLENGPGISFQNNLELISELDLHRKPAGQGYSKCVRRVAMVLRCNQYFSTLEIFTPEDLI